jgi:hypothetical protein
MMSLAANLRPAPRHRDPRNRRSSPSGGTRAVARDFAVLLVAALAIGVTAALGMMLAVLVLA